MQIRQFDKLQSLVKEAVDQILKLKLENKNLHRQISEMHVKVENSAHKNNEKFSAERDRLKSENIALREKHQVISARLRKVLVKVKSLSDGVES